MVGFLDRRAIQEDIESLNEQSSTTKETHCIHTVQLKLPKNLIPNNEEISKLNCYFLFFIYTINEIYFCNYYNANLYV